MPEALALWDLLPLAEGELLPLKLPLELLAPEALAAQLRLMLTVPLPLGLGLLLLQAEKQALPPVALLLGWLERERALLLLLLGRGLPVLLPLPLGEPLALLLPALEREALTLPVPAPLPL